MSAPVNAPASDLVISSGQTFWTEKQVAALRQLGVDSASNADLAVFFHQSTRTGLDPFARQIYMIEREGKQTIQTGIDGFRLIARRAVDGAQESLGYEDTLWCGKDGKWVDVWLADEPPAAAKVAVLRNGDRYPAVALYSEYVAKKRSGDVTRMWQTKGALMLAKCAEALALRKAFPQDLSGIYTSDEMQSSESAPTPDFSGAPAAPTETVPEKEILDAELVDTPTKTDGGAEAGDAREHHAPSSDIAMVSSGVSSGQLAKISAMLREQGITTGESREQDRTAALAYVGNVIGRNIASRNELTWDEAGRVIDALDADAAALESVTDDNADPVGDPPMDGTEAQSGDTT